MFSGKIIRFHSYIRWNYVIKDYPFGVKYWDLGGLLGEVPRPTLGEGVVFLDTKY